MNNFWRTFVATMLLVVLLGSTQGLVSGQDEGRHHEKSSGGKIGGVWRTMVTPRNCETGEPVAPAFPGLLSFHKDGILTGTSTVAAAVFGLWKRSGSGQDYSFSFTNLRYNSSGAFIGSQTVRQTARLDPSSDELISTGTVDLFDTNGTQIGAGCATSTGTRFE